jgi:hypothetical protein
MMYHLEERLGLSPDFATVKEAPSEPYVGLPDVMKLSDADEKSMLTVLPSAETGWQSWAKGLQEENVCAAMGRAKKAAVAKAAAALIVDRMADVMCRSDERRRRCRGESMEDTSSSDENSDES